MGGVFLAKLKIIYTLVRFYLRESAKKYKSNSGFLKKSNRMVEKRRTLLFYLFIYESSLGGEEGFCLIH